MNALKVHSLAFTQRHSVSTEYESETLFLIDSFIVTSWNGIGCSHFLILKKRVTGLKLAARRGGSFCEKH